MTDQDCEHCVFFTFGTGNIKNEYDEKVGTCRRYPPTVMWFNDRLWWQWPRVHPGQWCGEFKNENP